MALSNITVPVDSESAQIYQATPPKDQAKIRLLFSILLREFADSARSLEAIMDEIGERAQSLGLTEKNCKPCSITVKIPASGIPLAL